MKTNNKDLQQAQGFDNKLQSSKTSNIAEAIANEGFEPLESEQINLESANISSNIGNSLNQARESNQKAIKNKGK